MSFDATQNTPVAFPQGGASMEVSTVGGVAGAINLNSGGVLNFKAGSVEQDAGVARAKKVAISNGVGGSANICFVTFQVTDNAGNNLSGPFGLDIYLSDASTGIGITATTASGAVAASTSGTDLGDLTTKKVKRVLTDATGKYILSITDTAKTLFYPVAILGSGITVGAQLTSGSYHA